MEGGKLQNSQDRTPSESFQNRKLLLKIVPEMIFEEKMQYFMQLSPGFQTNIISYANTNKENPDIVKLLNKIIDESYDLEKYMDESTDQNDSPSDDHIFANFDADTYASKAATTAFKALKEKDPDEE